MKKIDYIVLSMVEPTDKNTVWAYPVGNGFVSLRVFNNGEWVSTDETIDLTPYLKEKDAQEIYATKEALNLKQDATDETLDTTDKTVVGAINELKSSVDSKATPQNITDAIAALDVETIDTVSGEVIKSVGQVDGKVVVEKKALGVEDIPELPQSKITNLETALAGKQSVGDYATNSALTDGLAAKQDTLTPGTGIEITSENQINVTLDTTVFKVVSVLPDSPAQGDKNKIHLVPAESTGANNAYTEYVWVNSAWEILGEYTSEVDLTPYLKTADAADTYLSKTNASSTYLSKTNASYTYLAKTDAVGKMDGTGEIFNSYEGGTANVASGSFSHAEGMETTASGYCSHAEGFNTTASGNRAHAEGTSTEARGSYSHAEGTGTVAHDSSSHAEGYNTRAEGDYSHVEGNGTQTFSSGEHAEGNYNRSYEFTTPSRRIIHSVGIGSSNNDRKNAHEIKFNGDHYIYGVGGYDGTNPATAQSLQTVLSNLGPNIIEVPELTDAYNIPANATMVEKIYMITIGATVYNVTGDPAIKWAGGVTPTASANSILVVSVLNNLATWQTFI